MLSDRLEGALSTKDPESLYRALNCKISTLTKDSVEWQNVQAKLGVSLTVKSLLEGQGEASLQSCAQTRPRPLQRVCAQS